MRIYTLFFLMALPLVALGHDDPEDKHEGGPCQIWELLELWDWSGDGADLTYCLLTDGSRFYHPP